MPVPYASAPQLLRDYLFYMLTIRGRSARTVDAYYIDLCLFFRYLRALKEGVAIDEPERLSEIEITALDVEFVKKITLSDIYAFLSFAAGARQNSAAARARKVSCIRTFFGYLCNKVNLLTDNPTLSLDTPSIKKTLPKYLTLEESIELLRAVDGDFRARDYLIITWLLNCGMRLSELVGINLQDIKNNTLRLLGKGNKERVVYLNNACLYALDLYLDARREMTVKPQHRDALLISRNGMRLSARRTEEIVENYLQRAGLSGRGFSPHKLRHTAATLMYQHGGVDIAVLKEILGHVSVATTQIYTHVGSPQIEKAMASIPLSRVKIKQQPAEAEAPGDESD